MKLIREKKIHPYIMTALVYVSFCASNWYMSRGSLALTAYQFPQLFQTAVLFNDVVAFLVAGIIPTLVFELISMFTFRFAQVRMGGSTDMMRYALRFFYVPANLVSFLIKLVYFITPLASVYGNIVIDLVVTAGFVAWFLFYSAKNFVPKERWGAMLYQVGGTFLIVYGILTAIGLLLGALL